MKNKIRAATVSHFTPLFLGFSVLGVLLVGIFGFLEQQAQIGDRVEQSADARRLLFRTFIALQDAETGQRGYLLTLDQSYLEPYFAALPEIADDLTALVSIEGRFEPDRGIKAPRRSEARGTSRDHQAGSGWNE